MSILFFRLLEYWTGFLKLDRAAFVDTVSAAFDNLHSHYSPGLPAWSLPPHSLAQNLFAFLFTIFYRPDRLIEGFGAGAYSAAVAAALSLAHRNLVPWAPPNRSSSLLEVWQCTLPPLPTSSGPLGQSTMQKLLSLRNSSNLVQTKTPDPQPMSPNGTRTTVQSSKLPCS